jgi:hypothetical protein
MTRTMADRLPSVNATGMNPALTGPDAGQDETTVSRSVKKLQDSRASGPLGCEARCRI